MKNLACISRVNLSLCHPFATQQCLKASKVTGYKLQTGLHGISIFFLILLNAAATTLKAQTTYVWNRTGSASFVTATNWTPRRNVPASNDILVFNGNGTAGTATTVTNVPTQAIGGLLISNNSSVSFNTANTGSGYALTINNGVSGADFSVAAGSQLRVIARVALQLTMSATATASITGNITFTNGAHRILAATAGAVVINSPCVFTGSTGFTGEAFGNTGTANTVVFAAGATYTASAGNMPFGLAAPLSKVLFQPGSWLRSNIANGTGLNFDNRTIANLYLNGSGTTNLTGINGFTADSIRVTAGTVNMGFTGTVNIKGNVNMRSNARLNFNGGSGTVNMAGTAAQLVYGSGVITVEAGKTLHIPVANTVNITMGLTINGTLRLNGTLNTNNSIVGGTGTFDLQAGANLGIGGSAGIAATGTNTGNIRTITRNYNTGANYIYNGASNQSTGTGLPSVIRSLIINKTAVTNNRLTLTANVTVTAASNSLLLQAGTFNVNTRQVTIAPGGAVTSVAGNFTTSTGTILFSGSGGTVGTMSLPNVVLAGPVTFGSGATIITSLQMSAGGVAVNSPVYGSSATLIYNSSTTVPGNEWLLGVAASAGVPNNVTINMSTANDEVQLPASRTIPARLTLTNGKLAIGVHTLTLNGSVTTTSGFIKGGHDAALVIGGAAGSLYFSAAVAENYLKTFQLSSGATARLGNALNITGGIASNAEGTLTVLGTGVLTTAGFLTIKSNQFGTARIAPGSTTGGYISGTVTVERYIPKNINKAWRLLCSPTSGQTIKQAWQENQLPMANGNAGYGVILSSPGTGIAAVQGQGFDTLSFGANLLKYNQATDNLDPVTNTSTTQISTQPGYFIYIRGDRSPGQLGAFAGASTAVTLRTSGNIYQGNQAPVNISAGSFALIANPYASAIDLTKIILSGGAVDAFQVWDPKLNGSFGSGAYQTFTRSGANYLVTPGGGSYGANGSVNNTIESGSAFFMQAVGSAGTVTLTENCKTAGSRLVQRPGADAENPAMLITNLYAVRTSATDLVDGNLVLFNDLYTSAVDINDVKKSPNFSENIGLLRAGVDLVVEKRQAPAANDTIFLNTYNLKRQQYRLQIEAKNMEVSSLYAFIEDRYLKTTTALNLLGNTSISFTVTSDAASAAKNRFSIVFKPAIVLPVMFTNIAVTQVSEQVRVQWAVQNQVNMRSYQVQQSVDGIHFNTVATIGANAAVDYTYFWQDAAIVAPTSFYRIAATDISGKIIYSAIVKLGHTGKAAIQIIGPNPAKPGDNISLQLLNQPAADYQINLLNITGQVIGKQLIRHTGGSAQQTLSVLKSAAAGVYQVQVISKYKLVFTKQIWVQQ
jgi:hypothetical protein